MVPLSYKIGAGVIIGVVAVSAVTLSYRHYTGLVDAKVELTEKVGKLEKDVAREKARGDAFKLTIDKWDEAAAKQAEALDDFSNAQMDAGTFSRELKNAFSRQDLAEQARLRPGPTADRLNGCIARTFRLLEQSTQGVLAPGAAQAAAAACAAEAGPGADGAGDVAGGAGRRADAPRPARPGL